MGVGFTQAPSWSSVQRDVPLSTGKVRCWLSRAADERDAQLGDRGDVSQTTPERPPKSSPYIEYRVRNEPQTTPQRPPKSSPYIEYRARNESQTTPPRPPKSSLYIENRVRNEPQTTPQRPPKSSLYIEYRARKSRKGTKMFHSRSPP